MNICILTHDENTSAGWGRYSDQVVRGLRTRGYRVVVLTETGGDHAVLRRRLGIFRSAFRALSFIRRCDVVHALDVYPFGIIAWLATRVVRRPLVISGVGSYSVASLRSMWVGALARRACRDAGAVLAISKYTARRMGEIVPRARIQVVNLGVSSPAVGAIQSAHSKSILSVGALKERKGYHIALEAFALARKAIPSLSYTIVGDQRDVGYVARLRGLVVQLGVEDAVHFKQMLSERELDYEYRSAGLFLLPSINDGDHFEGFGLVFLEAAAAGLPVVGTTENGIADSVGSDNGILVPQNDISTTADAIVSILGDRPRWLAMSEASSVWAEGHSVNRMIHHYEEVYRQLLHA